ncbi:MAG: hypothetical protein KDA57_08575 [Planctomycetales bacterium]|nr:hypothetical protein [Planctomycetales bacterium]
MIRFTRLFTAAAVLVHAIAGCCAHDGESCCEAWVGQATCLQRAGLEQCSKGHGRMAEHHVEDHAAGAGTESEHENPSHHGCHYAKCSWTVPELRTSESLLDLNITARVDWSLPCYSDGQLIEGRDGSIGIAKLSLPALPLRAHLAKCVLLI